MKIVRRLVLSVLVVGFDKAQAKDRATDYFRELNLVTDMTFGIDCNQLCKNVFLVSFYDVYDVNDLGLKNRLRHMFRKFAAAINPNLCKKVRFVVIKFDGNLPHITRMSGALHTPNNRLNTI